MAVWNSHEGYYYSYLYFYNHAHFMTFYFHGL